jgi:hypothetical protein
MIDLIISMLNNATIRRRRVKRRGGRRAAPRLEDLDNRQELG